MIPSVPTSRLITPFTVKKARPTVAQYPKISEALGQAFVSVLLGQAQPADALNAAAKTTDAALAEK